MEKRFTRIHKIELPLPSFKLSKMAKKRSYEIAFVGLKPGLHQFNYDLDDKFFTEKGAKDPTNIQASVKLILDKHLGFMLLTFEVDGKTDVLCDRCGNPISINLWDEFKLVVKLVDNPDEMNEQEEDPDVYYLSRNESHLDISDWLYEFVMLSIPMQSTCKDENSGGSQCNKEVLEKLKEMKERHNDQNNNPVWKGLEKFKKN